MMDSIEEFNRQLFLSLNASPETSVLMLGAAKFIANDLIFLIPLLLAGLWLWGDLPRRGAVLKAVLAMAVSLGGSFLIGLLWHHPRPLALELGRTYFDHALDASFPSDHATAFAAIGFASLKKETRQLGWAMLIVGAGVGWARIFLGVHFPADVLGAFAVAAAVCYGVSPAWNRAEKAVTGYCERLYRIIFAPLIAAGWIRN